MHSIIIKSCSGDERLPAGQAGNATEGTINQGTEAGIKNITPLNSKFVTNYVFPYQQGGDSLIYLKNSFRHRDAFYVKDINGEHRLRTRDISLDEQFSYRNGKIVYAGVRARCTLGMERF